jgi:aerobic-type carbon monoxide dehydrogenase small subunit (CoxS/CutS family)
MLARAYGNLVIADRLSSGAPEPIDETSSVRQAAEMTDDETRAALGGQLCRCTGDVGIVRAAAAIEHARRTP